MVFRCNNGSNKISVERIQEIADALAVPVIFFFEKDFSQPLPVSVPDTNYTTSEDEKTLLKYFKQIESNPDRQAVVQNARRLVAKR